ncbi:hypothetical protein [Lacisediminihabitans sp.]|jgi:hypothetical protein|uniref:hypothetical protein n=1 Tax=Lacisediminihabitans sp. TaxID=2787631 RepID=UPI002F94D432
MPDETLRLPNSIFQAVFDLGDKRAAKIELPSALHEPEIFAEWQDDENMVSLYVGFDDGQLHLDLGASGAEHHFHAPGGDGSENSPWNDADTAVLLEWATALAGNFFARMPELMEDIEEAAAWHEEGYPLYVCETEPAQLDLIEVEIEGEILTLPWLGSGTVSQDHVDGDNHPIALLWNPVDGAIPDRTIARAWLDPISGEPVTSAENGVDWSAVGLEREEVLSWLESIYLNHHITPDAEIELVHAVLERMGGLDRE